MEFHIMSAMSELFADKSEMNDQTAARESIPIRTHDKLPFAI
jgi:hypothetical protein